MSIIALCNQKGGVGKTTTTYHLARAAVLAGKKTLVIDMDPQGNLTSVLAPDLPEASAGIADALSERSDLSLEEVITEGLWEGLSIAPTQGESLGAVRDELILAGAGREARLKNALTGLAQDYDLILIDCGPTLDQLTINSLTAADKVLIITHTKLFSANGIAKLLTTISQVAHYYNPALKPAGFLINAHEARTVSGNHWESELQQASQARSIPLLQPVIPKRAAISDALEAAVGLDEWGKEAEPLAAMYATHLSTILKG